MTMSINEDFEFVGGKKPEAAFKPNRTICTATVKMSTGRKLDSHEQSGPEIQSCKQTFKTWVWFDMFLL